MPLCPRCGAAQLHDDEVCRECGKRMNVRPRVAADQTSLSFPTCIDGPGGCEGPTVERPDGRLRCSAHHLSDHLTVQRIPDPIPLACIDGPAGCNGVVALRTDGQLRCVHHQDLLVQPGWRTTLKRWFGRR
jgi:hypothetical protein